MHVADNPEWWQNIQQGSLGNYYNICIPPCVTFCCAGVNLFNIWGVGGWKLLIPTNISCQGSGNFDQFKNVQPAKMGSFGGPGCFEGFWQMSFSLSHESPFLLIPGVQASPHFPPNSSSSAEAAPCNFWNSLESISLPCLKINFSVRSPMGNTWLGKVGSERC